MKDLRRGAALLILLTLPAGFVGPPAYAQNTPATGNLQMPAVSPQQAEQFFATRTVPPSDVPAAKADQPAEPLQAPIVDPVLGRELPTDAGSAGFPRADFAIAKPQDPDKKNLLGDTPTISRSAPSTTVIHEEPPIIGKP